MKKLMTLFAIVFVLFAAIIFFKGTLVSRIMLSDAGSVVYHIAKELAFEGKHQNELSKNERMKLIQKYISRNVHSYGKSRDVGPAYSVIYGEAWCDTLASIYARFSEAANIQSYLVGLKNKDGTSPHSVAYTTEKYYDEIVNRVGEERLVDYLQSNAIVVDVQNNIIFNKLNQPTTYASPVDICNKKGFFPESITSRSNKPSLYCQDPIFLIRTNTPLSKQSFFKEYFYLKIFPFISKSVKKSYMEFAVNINSNIEIPEQLFYLARISQLFSDYTEAQKGYDKIINKFPETRWGFLAKYWKKEIDNIKAGLEPPLFRDLAKLNMDLHIALETIALKKNKTKPLE